MIRKIFLCISCLFFTIHCQAQKGNDLLIAEYADTLKIIANEIINADTDIKKINASNAFKKHLKEVLNYSKSFKYPFSELPPTISIISIPKKNIRIFTWFILKNDNTYKYYGIIHSRTKNSKKYKITELTDKSFSIRKAEEKELNTENWYGAYYYDVIHSKKDNFEYYTLLGFNGYDRYSSKKLIEVMFIDENNKIKFGLPIFNDEKNKKNKKRVILEHDAKTLIDLRYSKNEKKIIFNHLSPPSSELEGLEEYYIPDGTFDSYNLSRGEWWLKRDIDIRTKGDEIKQSKKIKKGLLPR